MKDAGKRIAENALETDVAVSKIQRQTIMDEDSSTPGHDDDKYVVMDEEDVAAQAVAQAVNDEREWCIQCVKDEPDNIPEWKPELKNYIQAKVSQAKQNIIDRIKEGK